VDYEAKGLILLGSFREDGLLAGGDLDSVTDLHSSPARRRFKAALLGAAYGVMITAVAAGAQAAPPPLPGAVQPGRDRELPPPPVQPESNFSIEAPHRSAVPRAVDEIHFKLNDIHIVGATTLPPESFRPLYQGLLGKDVTLSNIYDVADGIERAYRARGYPLVRAYVPPQRVKDGVFTIKVVEGYVTNVQIEGADPKTRRHVKALLGHVQGERPLRLASIERGLLLANDLPGVTATGVLRPAPDTPGASDLVVSTDQPKFTGGLAADNRGSRFSGIWTVSGDAEVNSLIFGGDQLMGAVTLSPNSLEQIGGEMRYRAPIGSDGWTGSFIGKYTHGEPGSTLHAFNVLTDSFAFGPRVSYPLIRSRAQTLAFDGGFTVQDAVIKFGSPALTLSHDKWRVIDIDMNYLMSDLFGGGFSASVDLAQGLDILGARKGTLALPLSRVGASPDFTKVAFGLRYSHLFLDDFGVLFAAQGQWSFNRLISGEQIAFGGTQIGRGYDPGAITGDRGIGGSLELRYNWRVAVEPLKLIQPFVFFDAARAEYFKDPSLLNLSIESVGIGARFFLDHDVSLNVEFDRTLLPVPGSDAGKLANKVLVDVAVRF
jgi:hemolysin activation/secretion protein